MELKYTKGNALEAKPNVIVAHVCNNVRVWGGGFVLAVTKYCGPDPANTYARSVVSDGRNFKIPLGTVQLVAIEHVGVENFHVCNMIAQDGVRGGHDKINYEALDKCFWLLAAKAIRLKCEIHMPRIGCGLAGSNWEKMLPHVEKLALQVPVTIFDL